jgi:hypothetical protein
MDLMGRRISELTIPALCGYLTMMREEEGSLG